jgi:hypothetical protein
MLRELFADPALAADKRYSDVLRGYLESDSVAPLRIRRLAIAHPERADAVFQGMRKPSFTWADHGEALLRRWKPWYYEHKPRPGVSVIGFPPPRAHRRPLTHEQREIARHPTARRRHSLSRFDNHCKVKPANRHIERSLPSAPTASTSLTVSLSRIAVSNRLADAHSSTTTTPTRRFR